jgi:hypothetical protein
MVPQQSRRSDFAASCRNPHVHLVNEDITHPIIQPGLGDVKRRGQLPETATFLAIFRCMVHARWALTPWRTNAALGHTCGDVEALARGIIEELRAAGLEIRRKGVK